MRSLSFVLESSESWSKYRSIPILDVQPYIFVIPFKFV